MNPSMQIELSLGLCTHHKWFCRKIVNTDVVSTSFVNGIILCICTYYYRCCTIIREWYNFVLIRKTITQAVP